MKALTIEMPRLSDFVQQATVSRWLKAPGEHVCAGEHLADLQANNTHVKLQACQAGVLADILLPAGSTAKVGTPIAIIRPISEKYDPTNGVKCSPLAAKLAKAAQVDLEHLQGSGPRGKIMAADVRAAVGVNEAPTRKVQTPVAPQDTQSATRVDNFYLFALQANMAYLAAISTPIAVQCEKLIGGRYSLFDYVVRAAVKACLSEPIWSEQVSQTDLLLALDKGSNFVTIEDAARKTVSNIAMERLAATGNNPLPAHATPAMLLCDSGVDVVSLRSVLPKHLHSIISIGGTTPKTGIEAGRPVSKLILPVSLYVNADFVPQDKASNIAAEFKILLENPVLLLL